MNLPDFLIFPKTGIRFLARLKRNNNREWFTDHRSEYERSVREPMTRLIEALAVSLSSFAPEIEATPRRSLYRIHRDTRFSRDKSPYKTHAAAVFPHKSLEKHEGAGFYFHISPSELLIGGGLYMPQPQDLRGVRSSLARDYERVHAILHSRKFQKLFGELTGEQLIRVPRGFSQDHPAGDLLRFKQFLAANRLPAEAATKKNFSQLLADHFEVLHPLVQLLNEPILANRRLKGRQVSLLS